ncbi:hypothetical protein IDH44_04565 [Paenibacillus sp. IB182496]|uniref:Uncharacterized protein n=1 Tax=Paenibacillus sabuli TaxID=2772509 RepID=A0A927BPQ9_9BACL|nr:hypothetical protein [Paenibacillus sabuli]MBD2844453.1 hypothetical protein [Paenibacillus sabuli]
MDRLIGLIFDNFFIFVIIIGFILSLLNKSKGKGRPNNRMPDFSGDGRQPQPRQAQRVERPHSGREQEEPYPAPPAYEAQPTYDPQPAYDARPEYTPPPAPEPREAQQVREVRRRREEAAERLRRVTEKSRERLRDADTDNPIFTEALGAEPPRSRDTNRDGGLAWPGQDEPGAEELRSAVLWAEILGPPRARRMRK